jgi:hypothetical protein
VGGNHQPSREAGKQCAAENQSLRKVEHDPASSRKNRDQDCCIQADNHSPLTQI